MHCLTATYAKPKDEGHFRSYYESSHVPLAKQLPGLQSCSFAYPAPLGPGAAPFCIFQAFFANESAMMAALRRLETAAQVSGPWLGITNAVSPFTNQATIDTAFFRVNQTVDTNSPCRNELLGRATRREPGARQYFLQADSGHGGT